MARKYEYIIHGRPLSSESSEPTQSPQKTLSVRKDHNRASNLRAQYRHSASPTNGFAHEETTESRTISNPTSPQFPPTPPTADELEHDRTVNDVAETQEAELDKMRTLPVTPVNAISPPTPDITPPHGQLKLPSRPYLALRPSIASTRAESFRTAREHNPETEPETSPPLATDNLSAAVPIEVPVANDAIHDPMSQMLNEDLHNTGYYDERHSMEDRLPSRVDAAASKDEDPAPLPQAEEDTPTKTIDDSTSNAQHFPNVNLVLDNEAEPLTNIPPRNARHSIHEQVTMHPENGSRRTKSLRDRLKQNRPINTASTEAFAHVIGWNDGGGNVSRIEEGSSNRWSGVSNLSAVEAYVVDSPIKPRKRGTLRKVVKNDSLRTVSSPIPESNRTSMQSTSDSPHRLVHKKQKLNNHHRWSTGSEVSKRSLSWGSASIWQKQEVIKVAVIPERRSSLHTSTSSSQRHSRSISATSAPCNISMPPVSTPMTRKKRALSDSHDKSPSIFEPPKIPARSSSLSAPTSRAHSRSNSINSQQVSVQREQAEKDLRTTLERMESERLSASLRRSSDQSSSPTPAPRKSTVESVGSNKPAGVDATKVAGNEDEVQALERPVTIEVSGIAPGTKEWADLRPATIHGTPFSQASMLSASPDIVEARIVNFFPHNNESLQLIEPYRLSETPAVKALKEQDLGRSRTVPTTKVTMTTPRASNHILLVENVDSPLRNPRKPPEPPSLVSFAVIPPTPQDELDAQLGPTPNTSPVKTRTIGRAGRRPSLQGRGRSESFIKSLSRGLSLRNARNPKADQELDSTLHPFWRPRAFWDDDDYRRRQQQDNDRDQSFEEGEADQTRSRDAGSSHGPHHKLTRSTSLALGPASLIRRVTEKRKQRRFIDDHLTQQQAIVKQSSYSSLQRFKAGRKLYGVPPLRSLSLNLGIGRLTSLRERMTSSRAKREDERRELRRERLRKSIGPDVVMQSDSRFPHATNEQIPGEQSTAMDDLLESARAEDLVRQRGLRL